MTRYIRSMSLALLVGTLVAGPLALQLYAQQPVVEELPDPTLTDADIDHASAPFLENPSLAQLIGVQFKPLKTALVVESIDGTSPLASSGLRAGDQFVLINGQRIESADVFYRWVPRARVGAASYFVVMRNEWPVTLTWTPTVTITQRMSTAASNLGVHVHPQIADSTVVAHVDVGSPADEAGLRPDDVICALNDREVAGPDDFAMAAAELPPEVPVRFTFTRVASTEAGGHAPPAAAELPPLVAPAVRLPVPVQLQQPAYSPAVRPNLIPQQQFPRRAPFFGRWR